MPTNHPTEQATPLFVTDDGIPLSPVDGTSLIGDLEVIPIEPPPFSRLQQRTKSDLRRAKTTSTPNDIVESSAVKRKTEREPVERSRRKEKSPVFEQSREVFGTDSRVLVTPTTGFPNRAICKLIVTYPWTAAGTVWGGTGCLIGSWHVLTAGHVLCNLSQGGWAKTIHVVPGMDGNKKWWFGSEFLVWPNFKQRSVKGWSEDQDIDYDYGLITLNTGFSVGSFGMVYLSDSTLDNTNAYITGYPGKKGSPLGTQQFGVPSGGGVTDYDSDLVYYSVDTSKGQSGSGVYTFWNGKRAIIAVHGGAYDDDENYGARITKARYNQIRKWQKEDA